MKKLTLNTTIALLAISCVAHAESCTNSTPARNDSAGPVRIAETPQEQSKPLTYADFRMVKQLIDFNFQRWNSIQTAALKCHMTVDHVNQLFKFFSHEDAEQYLANLKRNSSAAPLTKNDELTNRQVVMSFPDPYVIGR